MYPKKSIIIAVTIIVAILVGIAGYFIFNQKSFPAPIPAPAPEPQTDPITISLGKEFTLSKNQVAKIADTGLEIKIIQFYNSPCPKGAQCIWSGIGVALEYRLNGEVQTGIDLAQAFGYQAKIVKTDYETYAILIVDKEK